MGQELNDNLISIKKKSFSFYFFCMLINKRNNKKPMLKKIKKKLCNGRLIWGHQDSDRYIFFYDNLAAEETEQSRKRFNCRIIFMEGR